MQRRYFAKLAAAAPLLAQTTRGIPVAVLTHADGAHLSAYFPALAETAEAGSVLLCDPDGATVEAARKALGAKLAGVYRTSGELFGKHRPPLALVTMEAAKAPPVVEAALDAGCHVLAEKPACVRLEDFARLKQKADGNKRFLALALANRVEPAAKKARSLIAAGNIGRIYGLEMHWIADQTRLTRPAYHRSWYARKARGGGGHLIWLGIHWLDLAMFLTGSRITQVAGFTGLVGGQPIDVEDSAAVTMKFDNGSFGTLTSGYYLDRGYHSHLQIWGSHGWIRFTRHGPVPLEWYSTKDLKPEVQRVESFSEAGGYSPFVRACVRAAAGLGDPPLTNDDSLYALQTVFACYRAAETGKTQTVA